MYGRLVAHGKEIEVLKEIGRAWWECEMGMTKDWRVVYDVIPK